MSITKNAKKIFVVTDGNDYSIKEITELVNNVLVEYDHDGVTPDYFIPDQCSEDSKVDMEMEYVLQLISDEK